MVNWEHNIMGLARVTFLCGTVGLLFPAVSQGQFLEQFTPLQELTESGCVATPAWDEIIDGSQRFVAKMDGAAYCDRQTGLVWETEPSAEFFSWLEARQHCLNRTVGTNGQLGWRLPSIAELGTLVDKISFRCQESGICLPDGSPFRNLERTYWSATSFAEEFGSPTDSAWYGNFRGGLVAFDFKARPPRGAWCVRGASNADTY